MDLSLGIYSAQQIKTHMPLLPKKTDFMKNAVQ